MSGSSESKLSFGSVDAYLLPSDVDTPEYSRKRRAEHWIGVGVTGAVWGVALLVQAGLNDLANRPKEEALCIVGAALLGVGAVLAGTESVFRDEAIGDITERRIYEGFNSPASEQPGAPLAPTLG